MAARSAYQPDEESIMNEQDRHETKPEKSETELLNALRRRLIDAAINALDTCRFDDACALVGAYKAVTL